VPPFAIVDVGEEGRSAAADGEEEGSAAAASRLIDPRSGVSSPSLSRSNGERLSWRSGERERFWIEWTRTGGRCEDKDGRADKDIFGWRRAGSEIFLVVMADISNRYPKCL
jgi:hypothetical protein